MSYLQLAHNERHPSDRQPGREGDPQLRPRRPGWTGPRSSPACGLDLPVPGPGPGGGCTQTAGEGSRCSSSRPDEAGRGCWPRLWGAAADGADDRSGRPWDPGEAETGRPPSGWCSRWWAQRALEPASKLAGRRGWWRSGVFPSRAAPGVSADDAAYRGDGLPAGRAPMRSPEGEDLLSRSPICWTSNVNIRLRRLDLDLLGGWGWPAGLEPEAKQDRDERGRRTSRRRERRETTAAWGIPRITVTTCPRW